MLFHSPEFVFGFLPVTLVGFFLLARYKGATAAIGWLFVASLCFYAWGKASDALLIVASIAINFLLGNAIRRYKDFGRDRTARYTLCLGIAANLGLLAYFKYHNFLLETVGTLLGDSFVTQKIVLPLAISFFTLQQIAYLVDVYKREANEKSALRYALFVCFFPQLIAGPIVHHKEMLPQFRQAGTFRLSGNALAAGSAIFLLGLFKKVVLADSFGEFVTPVYDAVGSGAAPSFFEAWSATLAFSFEIYFDFSAYSDMALGLARMMSIKLPLNFDSPYRATNIIDFWRRWHMTLSRFLRDYLYIPFGGNRHGQVRRYAHLMATMLIGGLWHGAAWVFVIWGGLHGLYLMINHGWNRLFPHRDTDSLPGKILGRTITFLAVTISWVFFRSNDLESALRMLRGMAGQNGAVLPAQLFDIIPALDSIAAPKSFVPLLADGTVMGFAEMSGLLLIGFVVVMFPHNLQQLSQRTRLAFLLFCGGFVVQALLFGGRPDAFIYFRF